MADTLIVELDGEVIGDLMIDIQDGWSQTEVADRARGSQAELGWTMHPDHGGHGYATEAVAELCGSVSRSWGCAGCSPVLQRTTSWRLMAAPDAT